MGPILNSKFTKYQIDLLSAIDQLLKDHSISFLSLSPNKELATSITQILEVEAESLDSELEITEWILFCKLLIEESIFNFKENIFWDFDFFIHSLVSEYMSTIDKSEFLEERKKKIFTIFRLFGSHSLVRFKYLHDFLYGYDWYKWRTQIIPNQTNDLNPFGLSFLNYIEARGYELIELIGQNDTNYPQIEKDENRNPFYFSRSKEDESLLWRSLAQDDLIPIPSWEREIFISLSKNYSEIRNLRAIELQITTNQSPGAHKS
ncbi:MAG: hypothetical protein CK427_02860 [Leptospira sp.]|nr:MAG: hypothetical protein CK427_02860 [Leptospira sp.]